MIAVLVTSLLRARMRPTTRRLVVRPAGVPDHARIVEVPRLGAIPGSALPLSYGE